MDIGPDVGEYVGSEDEMELEDQCEPRSRYDEGLYYPLHIGEVLDARYRILHKLGWGGFSTVWLARDLTQNQIVAIKVMVANDTTTDKELDIQTELTQALSDKPNLTLYIASFQLRGVNNRSHLCLVLPLRGTSFNNYHTREHFSVAERMSAARMVLHAIASIHSVGIIHRDLNLGALLWDLKPIDHLTKDEIYHYFGRPRKVKIDNLGWKSGELVEQLDIPDNFLCPSVYLGDFGLSIRSGTPIGYTVQAPMSFCAPERYHGMQPSYASDIWSYTCIFATLYLGVGVVHGHGTISVARLVGTLGPLPAEWKGHYCGPGEAEDWWYDHSGLLPRPAMDYVTLEQRVDYMRPEISGSERELVLSILHRGLSYYPQHRPAATEWLVSQEFTSLMAKYGL